MKATIKKILRSMDIYFLIQKIYNILTLDKREKNNYQLSNVP